mgnify:CR=1 FL=1
MSGMMTNKEDSMFERIDMFTPEDNHLVDAAYAGVAMDPEVEFHLDALIKIEGPLLGEAGQAPYNDKGRHKYAVYIGEYLDEFGGMRTMQAVAYRLQALGHEERFAEIGYCWDGIGDWQC